MKLAFLLSLVGLAVAAKRQALPPVNPKSFPSDIHLESLLRGSLQLQDFAYAYPPRNRVFGGHAHSDTVNWLYNELRATGYYDVYKQPQKHLWTSASQSLVVNGSSLDASTMTYSPSVNVTAPLAIVSNNGCAHADYPSDLAGKIALIPRGVCTFAEKSVAAAAAGAQAAILYNNVEGALSGTLGGVASELGPYAPIVGISLDDGETLLDMVSESAVTASLWISSRMENRTTYNIIAQTKGGDQHNVVALGGHTDSVDAGAGINDDGSGIVSNLVIAKALTKYAVRNAVRFLFFTAEEFGLLGSTHYISTLNTTELAKIRLYMNFDMIASPNYALMIYDGDGKAFNMTGPPGSAQIQSLFQEYFASVSQNYTATPFNGRSDYQAFIANDIPSGGLFTGAEGVKTAAEAALFGGDAGTPYDENYHAAGDNFENLNYDAYLINAQATAYAVATYADSLQSIPKRGASEKRSVRTGSGKFEVGLGKRGKSAARARAHNHVHAKGQGKGTGCWHERVEA